MSDFHDTHWSSDTDEWATPPDLLRPLNHAVGGFDLDPCSGAEERSIARETYTAEDDGLSQNWAGRVWMNPPYSDVADWMEKAHLEALGGDVECVVTLVPARTSTQWYHNWASEASALCFLEGRLSFGDADNSAPFPSLIAVFGAVPDALEAALDRRGAVFRQQQRAQRTVQATLPVPGGEQA